MAISLILSPTPNDVLALLRKHFASYRKIKRAIPVVHKNTARSLLVSPAPSGGAVAPFLRSHFVTQQRHPKPRGSSFDA
jgi:hypothetical protein